MDGIVFLMGVILIFWGLSNFVKNPLACLILCGIGIGFLGGSCAH